MVLARYTVPLGGDELIRRLREAIAQSCFVELQVRDTDNQPRWIVFTPDTVDLVETTRFVSGKTASGGDVNIAFTDDGIQVKHFNFE